MRRVRHVGSTVMAIVLGLGLVVPPANSGMMEKEKSEYNSVVIWCQKFSVEIGHAFFEKGMMEKRRS